MRNIFHIGYHKTASTWFQKRFYPKVLNTENIERSKIRAFFYENKNEIFENSKDVIFCDEELSGNIHNGGFSGFLTDGVVSKISKFENPKVIIFIRNQYDIITSSYLQYIKEGGNYSLKRYINHKDYIRSNRTALFSYSHFDYLQLITKYENQIGTNNVFVYLYEDFVNNQKQFISNFIKAHNFEIDINKIDFSRKNSSYSFLSLILARVLNCFSRKNVLYKYYLIHIPYMYEYAREILRRIKIFPINNKSFLGKNLQIDIQRKYAESNKKLVSSYNLDLEKYNYPL